MAKKKQFKLAKTRRKQLAKLKLPFLYGLLSVAIGLAAARLLNNKAPTNMVWAADNTVKVPADLKKFLMKRDDCKAYKGTGSPTGVGLWGVYQVSHAKFAKIAYGCSWNLTTYEMAVKVEDKWQLLKSAEYFAPFNDAIDARTGALPFCAVTEKYKIPADIEPFCILADGSAQSNTRK